MVLQGLGPFRSFRIQVEGYFRVQVRTSSRLLSAFECFCFFRTCFGLGFLLQRLARWLVVEEVRSAMMSHLDPQYQILKLFGFL